MYKTRTYDERNYSYMYGGRSDVWCIGLFVSSIKTSITLRGKKKYLIFKYNTLNNYSLLRVRGVRAARSVTQTLQIYNKDFD